MKTVRISDRNHSRLLQVKGKLIAQNGKPKMLDDAVSEVLDYYEENKKC